MDNLINELVEKIKYHKDKYYNGQPEISDAEYDLLEEELKMFDPDNEILLKVGSEPSFGKKITHTIPMGSLFKCTFDKDKNGNIIGEGLDSLNEWYQKHSGGTFIWSLKHDGCAIEILYENGKLTNSSTRGDGLEGSDITDNIRMINTIPKSITANDKISVRGELEISKSFFEKNLKDKFDYANCRNAASGIIQSKDPNDVKNKGLQFRAYEIFINDNEMKSEKEKEAFVNSLGLQYVKINKGKLNKKLIDDLDNRRSKLDFDIDGIVIGIDRKSTL